jgi:hypothetical protein
MEMAAEGALLVSPNLGSCAIDPTFTAEVEQRTVKEVRVYEEYCLLLRRRLMKIDID